MNGVDLGAAFGVAARGGVPGCCPALSLSLNEAIDVNVGPFFGQKLKDGCVGACDLVRTPVEAGDLKTDEPRGGDDVGAEVSPRKKPRKEAGQSDGKEDAADEVARRFDLDSVSSVDELGPRPPLPAPAAGPPGGRRSRPSAGRSANVGEKFPVPGGPGRGKEIGVPTPRALSRPPDVG